MPCKPGGEARLVQSLREICMQTIRSNLQHLVGVKNLPFIFKQEILQMILKEIKNRRRCELKWAYFVSLSRSVKKFLVQSVPSKTLATKVLNIRPKRRVLRLLSGANVEAVVRECLSETQSFIEAKQKKLNKEAKKAERNGKQFKAKKDRYEKKLARRCKRQIQNYVVAGGNRRYYKSSVQPKQQWKVVASMPNG
eukprot:g10589.t1